MIADQYFLLGPLPPAALARILRKEPFVYPPAGLARLSGVVPLTELRGDDEDLSIMSVLKHGISTGVTVGKLSPFQAVRREYATLGTPVTSIDLCIRTHTLDHAITYPFSVGGDSGALIVDPLGWRFVGLLTGGPPSCDLTFATPFDWIWTQILSRYPGATIL